MKVKLLNFKYLKRDLVIFSFFFTVSFISIFLTDILIINILSFYILTLGCLIIVRLDILHPYVWYLPFFTLYSTAYPILYLLGDGIYGLEKKVLVLEWIAMVTFILIIGFRKVNHSKDKYNITKVTYITKLLYFLSCLIIVLLIFLLANSTGLSSKIDVQNSNNILINRGYIFVYLAILCFSLIYSNNLMKGINSNKIAFATATLISVLFLFTGERDTILRLILIIILVRHVFYKKISSGKLLLIGGISLSTIPILQRLKTFGLTGQIRSGSSKGFIFDFLNSDFSAAGRNLQILVSSETEGVKHGLTLINALLRPLDYFVPFNTSDYSALVWFADTFFPGRVTGMGFTYVGEGYINFGTTGVIIWFVILSTLIRLLYRKSEYSFITFIIYIMMVPITIYSLRADLTNVTSPLVKQILIPIMIIFVCEHIINRVKGSKNVDNISI